MIQVDAMEVGGIGRDDMECKGEENKCPLKEAR
jgi:hypothetical protein